MAGGVNINGQIIRVPGIYGTYDADSLGGSLPSIGNLALVGSFPFLEASTPTTVATQQAMKALNPNSPENLQLARLCFNPAADDRINGAATVTLVNASPNAQAYRILNDANGNGSIKIKSKLWGSLGNKISVNVSAAQDNKRLNFSVTSNGTVETYRNLGSGNVVSFSSTCEELKATTPVGNDACVLSVGHSGTDYSKFCNNLSWGFSRGMWQTVSGTVIALPKNTPYTFVDNKLPVTGKLYMEVNQDVPVGGSCLLTVTGADQEGNEITATAVATSGAQVRDRVVIQADGQDVLFSRLDSMQWNGEGTATSVPRILEGQLSGGLPLTNQPVFSSYGIEAVIDGASYTLPWGTAPAWSLSIPDRNVLAGDELLNVTLSPPGGSPVVLPVYVPIPPWADDAAMYASIASQLNANSDNTFFTANVLPEDAGLSLVLNFLNTDDLDLSGVITAAWDSGSASVLCGQTTNGTTYLDPFTYLGDLASAINASNGGSGDPLFTASTASGPFRLIFTAKVPGDGNGINTKSVAAAWNQDHGLSLSTVTQTQEGGTSGGSYDTPPSLVGTSFDLDLSPASPFNNVAEVVAYFAPFDGIGFHVAALSPQIANIPPDQMDALDQVATLGVTAYARADVWAILQALAASNLVVAERVEEMDSGLLPPFPWGSSGSIHRLLTGGGQTAMTLSSFEDALSTIVHKGIQTVVATHTTDIAFLQTLVTHCIDSAVAGYERNAYGAAAANQSISAVRDNWVNQLNTRHVSLVAQQPQLANPLTGALSYWDTWYSAVIAGAMQSGRGIGIPLTNKKPNALGFKQAWALGIDDNEVIAAGIYAFTLDDTGYKVLRSITTWVTDDNPVYAEVSANESGNYTVRDLRSNLKQKIGDPALLGPNQFKGVITAILGAQVAGGFITSWVPESLAIIKVADKYSIDYDFVPVFPFNFGIVHAHALAG